jgi:hypothetical protein
MVQSPFAVRDPQVERAVAFVGNPEDYRSLGMRPPDGLLIGLAGFVAMDWE